MTINKEQPGNGSNPMQLPIDVVPGTHPRKFRWQQHVSTPNGAVKVAHVSVLPPTVEAAVADLIEAMKKLMDEHAAVKDQNGKLAVELTEARKRSEGLAKQVATQVELLAKRAEKPTKAKG